MLKLPSVTMRGLVLLGIFLGMVGPGVAATTASLGIRVVVHRPVLVADLASDASAALRGSADVVDARGRPLQVAVQFAPASAPAGTRFVVVLADGGPLAGASTEAVARGSSH
jgi:hypothetical protein